MVGGKVEKTPKIKEHKKALIVYVLKLLENKSDAEHPWKQVQICDDIRHNFMCDRKTICRNIQALIDLGYPIVKTKQGFYMGQRAFTVDEVEQVVAPIKDAELAERVRKILTNKLIIKKEI